MSRKTYADDRHSQMRTFDRALRCETHHIVKPNDTNSEEANMPVTSLRIARKYTELPERARKAIDGFIPDEARIAARIEQFRNVKARPADKEGDVEILDGVKFTHHFV